MDNIKNQEEFNSKNKSMWKETTKGIQDSMTKEEFTRYCQLLEEKWTDVHKQTDLIDKVEKKDISKTLDNGQVLSKD